MRGFGAPSLRRSGFAVLAALGFVTACGDADTYRLRAAAWGETEALTSWNGTLVQLVRATTPCASNNGEGIVVAVGAHVEFSGEQVATLKSACSVGAEVEVSIDVGARSIVYDFSSVARSGNFTAADFNGYIFTEVAEAAPEIVGAIIDRSVSTLLLDDDALQVEGHVLQANFEGIRFDRTDFVKIDLLFAEPG